ncbi:MAG: RNA polymerase sigma factor [Candidatus Buchananbacteria bacterium]|nr:RNA polymerase sigma factor [Candidatus Buchananbacteria bacterium]
MKKQDPEAFGQFYDQYATRIYRFIFFKVSSESDAQDLTADVFLRLWNYLKDGREVANLNALVYQIARNAVIDFYRQRQRRADNELQLDSTERALGLKIDPHEAHIQKSLLDAVSAGLTNLKDEYSEVIVLRYLDGLSHREIAQALNKSTGTVRVLLHRALRALRETVHN